MRKIYFLLLSFVFISRMFSQTDSTPIIKQEVPVLKNVSDPGKTKSINPYLPFTFGPRIGVATTMLSNNDFYGRSFRPVINAGGVFNYHINNYFSIGTEVYFTQHAKNYECMTKSNLIPKLTNNMYLFGVDTFLVDLLFGALNSGTTTPIHDTIYSYTKGTFKMSALELPLLVNFHYKGFKFTGGAYASLQLSTTSKEIFTDKVPFLDLLGPTMDTLVNTLLGGTPEFNIADYIIYPAAPYYKKPFESSVGSVTDLASVTFGYLGDISYTFDNNVNIGLRINYPWMTFKPNVNVSYVRNTQFVASLSYYFKLKKGCMKRKSKAFSTH